MRVLAATIQSLTVFRRLIWSVYPAHRAICVDEIFRPSVLVFRIEGAAFVPRVQRIAEVFSHMSPVTSIQFTSGRQRDAMAEE